MQGVSIIEFGHQIKNIVIPVLSGLIRMVSNTINWFTGLNEKVKENVIKILLLAGALGPILILFSSLVSVVLNVIKVALIPLRIAFVALRWVITLLFSPLKTLTNLFAGLKAFALANPITATILGVVAAVFILNTAIHALVNSWG